MAKIHNPQDQDGILLINQTVFNGEISARSIADTLLQSNIDNEVADRQAADSTLQQNIEEEIQNRLTAIENEKTRAEEAESTLNDSLAAEVLRATEEENRISTSINTLETKVDEHVETLDTVDASLLAKIDEEKDARISADENINTLVTNEVSRATAAENELSIVADSIDDRLLNIEGKVEFTTLEQQPTTTSQWTALEFKDNSHWVSNVSNKRITSISFKVANTVSTPHYLGVYDTRTAGSKILVATSKGTTWEANGNATFKFSEPIIIPGKFELFLLNEPISGNHNSDLPAPDVFVESYTVEGTQNYRLPAGTWAKNAKRAFYVTFNFVTDRLGTLESKVSSHDEDTIKHITAEERSKWDAKATIENVSDLESRINTTVQTLATKAEIADFVTKEIVDQKIAAAEHHKPIFDLERNVDKVVFDIATSTEPQVVNLVLSEGKIFAGNVVVSNPVISAALGIINPGVDNMLNVNIGLQETPTSSMNLYIIIDTICDDDVCSNAQHVAEVIPVEIIVPEASE